MVTRSIPRQLLGTLVAAVAGWLVSLVFLESTYLVGSFEQHQLPDVELLFGSALATSWFMAWFIIPIWVVILIPLYLFIPVSSTLWRWPVCTACGGLAGFLVMSVFFRGIPGVGQLSSGAWDFFAIATVVGGVTCLTAALTKHIFKPTR